MPDESLNSKMQRLNGKIALSVLVATLLGGVALAMAFPNEMVREFMRLIINQFR